MLTKCGYLQALLDPKHGPLVGIPTFVPINTQRQRVRAGGTISTDTGALTVLVNPRRMVANTTGPVRCVRTDGAFGFYWAENDVRFNVNSDYTADDFVEYDGDLKARVVALQVTVKNVSDVGERHGMFYALQEPHHHNLDGKTSSIVSGHADCKIQSATDGDIYLLYRPCQPRETKDWQHSPYEYPDEDSSIALDNGPTDPFPGCLGVWWIGNPTIDQTFHIEVDAIIEYAGESTDMVASHPSIGAHRCVSAQPGDFSEIFRQVQMAEAMPSHLRALKNVIC